MKYPTINGLVFDQASIRAIKDIKERQERSNVLATIFAASVLFEIFGGRGGIGHPLEYSWNINQYDWIAWAQTMASVPAVLRGVIQRIAFDQAQIHRGKEKQFWEALMYACS